VAIQHGQRSCGLSTIGTTSFFPSKPLGGYGDGDACFTDDFELANRMRRISRHGQTRRYFHTDLGVKGCIDTLQAAIVLAKLLVFESEVQARGRIGESVTGKLRESGITNTPKLTPGSTCVYDQYTIEVSNRLAVQAALKDQGIPTAVHYPTLLCKQPALADPLACSERCPKACSCPVAQSVSERVLSSHIHPKLSEVDQDRITSALVQALR